MDESMERKRKFFDILVSNSNGVAFITYRYQNEKIKQND